MKAVEMAVSTAAGALGRTWRVDWVNREPVSGFRRHGQPFIFALWHADLLPLLWFHRGSPTALLVSAHRDGRMLATAAARWGYRVIDGSSTRQGAVGLRGVIRTLREGREVAMTPDGPKGPARVVKHGVLAAAQAGALVVEDETRGETGVPIVPVAAVASAAWRLGSWDRMQIPKPFARVRIAYGPPVTVTSGKVGRVEAHDRLLEALRLAEDRARC